LEFFRAALADAWVFWSFFEENNVQTILFKRSKSNNFSIYPPTGYSKLVNFDHIGENDQTYPKPISTTNDPEIKVNSVLEYL